MDLTNFTNSKKKDEKVNKNCEKIIIDNDEIKILKINDSEIEFFIKKKSALKKYQDFLFLSPTNSLITNSKEEANTFFQKSLSDGVEGLMFKNLKSEYKPGLRSGAMAKLKETKEDIDVVILKAEHGMGKRAGFYSSFYVAVKNSNLMDCDMDEEFLEIGKVASGVKEIGNVGASLENLTKLLNKVKIKEESGITFFEPKVILQIKYQEIQKSTTYNSGYALRFPRIIMLREDKSIDEINSVMDIEKFIN